MFDEMIFQVFGGYTDPIMIAQCFLMCTLLVDAAIGLMGVLFSMGGTKRRC